MSKTAALMMLNQVLLWKTPVLILERIIREISGGSQANQGPVSPKSRQLFGPKSNIQIEMQIEILHLSCSVNSRNRKQNTTRYYALIPLSSFVYLQLFCTNFQHLFTGSSFNDACFTLVFCKLSCSSFSLSLKSWIFPILLCHLFHRGPT